MNYPYVMKYMITLLLLTMVFLCACHQDPLRKGSGAVHTTVSDFMKFVRWQEFERAVSFVESEYRSQFIKKWTHAAVRITDYQVLDIRMADKGKTATVDLGVKSITPSRMTASQINLRQNWVKQRGRWWLKGEQEANPLSD